MSNNIRYLNEQKIASHDTKRKVQIVIALIFGSFNLFGFVSFIIEKDPGGVALFGILLLPFAYLFWCGINTGILIESARRYETVFGGDRDGFVTVEELSTMFGKPGYKLMAELEKLFRRGYFQNCTLQQGGHPGVVIYDAPIGENGVGFIEVKCPNCGGINRIRSGSHSKCTFCGGPVSGQ
ncbi:MAG: hypothetical protein J5476_12515 [Lachnospiraceae bacterium]|nr:hypothetical protein [Lachnospiraceae bacterium]